jgi:hypothetical protein
MPAAAPTRPAVPMPSPAPELAAAIVEAGRRRRGELDIEGPPIGSLAARIINAGRRRRGEL